MEPEIHGEKRDSIPLLVTQIEPIPARLRAGDYAREPWHGLVFYVCFRFGNIPA